MFVDWFVKGFVFFGVVECQFVSVVGNVQCLSSNIDLAVRQCFYCKFEVEVIFFDLVFFGYFYIGIYNGVGVRRMDVQFIFFGINCYVF